MIDRETRQDINCEKWIIGDKDRIILPSIGEQNNLYLSSELTYYRIVINRKSLGDEPVFTVLLLKNEHRKPIVRLDLFGPSHYNESIGFPYSHRRIKTPHIHILNQSNGKEDAYPLNEEYAKMYITQNELWDRKKVVKRFLDYCHVMTKGLTIDEEEQS